MHSPDIEGPVAADFVVLLIAFVVIIGVFLYVYNAGVYKAHPGWGAVRKFESGCSEDLRINQYHIARHCEDVQFEKDFAEAAAKDYGRKLASGEEQAGVTTTYGAAGSLVSAPKTSAAYLNPGTCQSPYTWKQETIHEQYGPVKIHHGFTDTQFMREQVGGWARDGPHFLQSEGIRSQPLSINALDTSIGEQVMACQAHYDLV